MKNVFVTALLARLFALVFTILLFTYCFANAALTNPTVAVQGEVLDSGNKPTVVYIQVVDSEGNIISRTKSNSTDGKFYIAGLASNKEFTIKLMTKNSKLLEVRKIITPNTSKFEEMTISIKLNQDMSFNN